MKLVRAVERLEGRLSAVVGGDVGLVWSRDERRVEREPGAGEYVACDMRYVGPLVEGVTPTVRLEERITRGVNDLGWVYDDAGAVVGRVMELNGSLITICRQGSAAELVADASGAPEPIGVDTLEALGAVPWAAAEPLSAA
jgi:hypothetical protein